MKDKFAKVIVVDMESHRPMSWDGKQFCFVPPIKLTSKRSTGFKVKTYQKQDAILLIKSDQKFRKDNGLYITDFLLCLAQHGKC